MTSHPVDRAWLVLGVAQIELVMAEGGLTRNQLAAIAIEGLGPEPWNTYELNLEALTKLANTSLQQSEKMGLVLKAENKYWASDSLKTLDVHEIREQFIRAISKEANEQELNDAKKKLMGL